MKRNPFRRLVLWLLLVAGCTPRPTTVTLHVRNLPAGELYALLPTDGGPSLAALDTIRWTGDTTVLLSIQTDGNPTAMSLFGHELPSVQTVCGREDFSITIDPSDSLSTVRFEGPNAEGRRLLQRLSNDRNVYRYEWVRDFSRAPLDTVAVQMEAQFAALASAEAALFDSLEQAGAIDADFGAYARLDAQVYHALSLSKVLYADFANTDRKPQQMRAGYGALWDRLYEELPVIETVCRTSVGVPYANSWANRYMEYRDVVRDTLPPPFHTQEAYRTHLLGRAELFADPEVRQTYLGSTLVFQCLNNKTYDTTLVAELDRYAQAYPNSRLNDYFLRHRTELNQYYRKLDQADTTQIHFVPRADSMRTLAEVLALFKGKPVFVDFWFSTCAPCLDEMQESGPLKAFLKQRGIELLYISIDRPERDLNWRNAIKFHQLYGHHLRTPKALHEELYKKQGVHLFPTYMLVDAAGEIVLPRAKKPSEGQALFDQIEAAL